MVNALVPNTNSRDSPTYWVYLLILDEKDVKGLRSCFLMITNGAYRSLHPPCPWPYSIFLQINPEDGLSTLDWVSIFKFSVRSTLLLLLRPQWYADREHVCLPGNGYIKHQRTTEVLCPTPVRTPKDQSDPEPHHDIFLIF